MLDDVAQRLLALGPRVARLARGARLVERRPLVALRRAHELGLDVVAAVGHVLRDAARVRVHLFAQRLPQHPLGGDLGGLGIQLGLGARVVHVLVEAVAAVGLARGDVEQRAERDAVVNGGVEGRDLAVERRLALDGGHLDLLPAQRDGRERRMGLGHVALPVGRVDLADVLRGEARAREAVDERAAVVARVVGLGDARGGRRERAQRRRGGRDRCAARLGGAFGRALHRVGLPRRRERARLARALLDRVGQLVREDVVAVGGAGRGGRRAEVDLVADRDRLDAEAVGDRAAALDRDAREVVACRALGSRTDVRLGEHAAHGRVAGRALQRHHVRRRHPAGGGRGARGHADRAGGSGRRRRLVRLEMLVIGLHASECPRGRDPGQAGVPAFPPFIELPVIAMIFMALPALPACPLDRRRSGCRPAPARPPHA